MGKIKHMNKVMDFLKKTYVANIRDIRLIVKDPGYTRLLLFNLLKQKKINQLTKGFYTIYNDPSLAVFCFKPAYIGLQDALSIHGLWEQETNTVIITSRKIRSGVRDIFDNNVVIHRIDKKYLFGYEYIKQKDFYIPVSDIEKTFIDFVYFNEMIDEEVIKKMRKIIDKNKLNKYLKNYPENFRKRVLRELVRGGNQRN